MVNKGGRPQSDNPRTFSLPEIRLTREEKRMIQMKAQLHNGGNVSAYIRDLAINDNRSPKPIETCSCGCETLHIVNEDQQLLLDVAGTDRSLTLKGVPRSQCKDCGQIMGDFLLDVQIESVIDEEMLWRLNHRQPIPDEMEFDELLSVTH